MPILTVSLSRSLLWFSLPVKEDPNLSLLTVWETLLFSASLRQLPLFSPKLHRFIVSLVLKLLGLSHIKDSIVGDVLTRGISGGERRRLSYGCELVAGHHMILADLPTNGLDSHSAANLFRAVKFASLTGRATMASIVQPTQELFEMFDRIVLLCKGSMIFQGRPSEAEAHFNAAGFLRPQGKTVPAWLEEMSATPEKFWRPHKQAATARALQASPASVEDDLAWASEARQNAWKTLDQAYVNSKFNKEVMEIIKQSLANQEQEQTQYTITAPPSAASSLSSASALAPVAPFALASFEFPLGTGQYRLSFPQQLRLVLQRQVLLLKRNRGMWIGFWVQSIVLGLILGSLFWQLGTEQKEVRVRFGLFWFIMMTQSFGVAQMIPALCEQRVTYYNQINNAYYHPAAYYLGTVLPQLPVGLIQVMILVTILYPMSGLINGIGSGEYWFMCLLLLLVNWTARSFVMFICSISPSELVAQMLIPIFTLLFSSMCGFMNPKDAIPAGQTTR
jgi:ABC-type multidrug transport system ATPase subunit